MNEREIELDRRLENLKNALKEYVDYVEYIKKENAAPKKMKPSKGTWNDVFVYDNTTDHHSSNAKGEQ